MTRVDMDRRSLRSLPRAALRRVSSFHTVDVVRRPTTQKPPSLKADSSLVLHRVTAASDPLLLRAPVGVRRLKRVPAAVARGDAAYVATVDDSVVAWVWLSRASHRDTWSGLRFRLAPAECYSYDLWSLPEYRTLGVGAFLMEGLLHDLADDPTLKWVYGYIDKSNRANQMLLRMVFGFRTVQAVRHLCILDTWGWQLPFTDNPPVGPCSRGR